MITKFNSFLLAGLLFGTSASPCGFHNYAPQPTMVDQLLGSDDIVLARAASDNPFRFEAFKALEGNLGPSEIPYLLDSTTRRRLALDANAAVLFARDGAYGPWQRLAFIDAAMAPVLNTVMERLPVWESGEDLDRFSYFATLVGHPDDRIHKLSLRELDLADYGLLRELRLEIDPSRLLHGLDNPFESEFKPIRVLLLGLSGADSLRDRLEQGVASNIAVDGRYIGAYATALIELAGPDAVRDIAGNYLTDRSLSIFTRELLVEAISLHGQTGDPVMDVAISEAIENVLWVDPSLAGAVARRFGSRSDWTHQPALEALLTEGSMQPLADLQDVSQYLTLAKEFGDQP